MMVTIFAFIFSVLQLVSVLVLAELKEHVSESDLQSLMAAEDLIMAAFISVRPGPPRGRRKLMTKCFVLAYFCSDSSQSLYADYVVAASALKAKFVTVNCIAESSLCKKYDINAFPALRVFHRDEPFGKRYRGSRNAKDIISFMTAQALPPLSTLASTNITAFKSLPNPSIFIAYLSPSDTSLISSFTGFASAYHTIHPSGLTLDPALAAAEGTSLPSVVCYQPSVNDAIVLSGSFTAESLASFQETCSTPSISPLTRRNIDSFLALRKPIAYLFLPRLPPSSFPTQNDVLLASLHPFAKAYGPYVSFVHVDAVEYGHMAPMLELEEGKWPAFVVHDMMRDDVYVYPQDEDVNRKGVERLVLGVLQQTTVPTNRKMEDGEAETRNEGSHDEL